MKTIELIELLILRQIEGIGIDAVGVFDPDDVSAVYLELVLGWYIVEVTTHPEPGTSEFVLDSSVKLTPKGARRLAELEANITMVDPRSVSPDRRTVI